MTRLRLVTLAAGIAIAASALPAHAQAQYRARLSMVPTDLAMQSTISGIGSATAVLKGTTLTINGTFSGLKTPATVVRIHRSAKPGMRGAPIGELKASQETSGTITG